MDVHSGREGPVSYDSPGPVSTGSPASFQPRKPGAIYLTFV